MTDSLSLDFPALATNQGASGAGARRDRSAGWAVGGAAGARSGGAGGDHGRAAPGPFQAIRSACQHRGERGRPDSARTAVPVRAAPAVGAGLARADRRRQGVGEAASAVERRNPRASLRAERVAREAGGDDSAPADELVDLPRNVCAARSLPRIGAGRSRGVAGGGTSAERCDGGAGFGGAGGGAR